MFRPFVSIVVVSCLVQGAARAQNTPAQATPQTQAAAPAGIGANAGAASTTPNTSSGRRGRGSSGGRRTGGGSAASQGQPGITGVPAYDPGSSGQQRGPAPAANSRVVVTGDDDGNGILDRNANSLDTGAPLPGITLQHNSLGVKTGTPIQVRLRQPVDSGHAINGQTVEGSLVAPLGQVPAGAPVRLTVVAVAKAGEIDSYGELSLQVVSVNGVPALSQVITAEGKEGVKILPDDAPARGTEAIFTPDQTITLPAA